MAKAAQPHDTASTAPAHGAESVDPNTGEITNGDETAVAVAAPNPFAVSGVKIKRRVSEATFTFEDGMSIVARFLVPIHEGDEVKEGARGPRMGKALVTSIQSPSGDVRNLVVGTILHTELTKTYPNHAYVGCWFLIEKHAPKREKRYSTYTITEIYAPDGAVELPLEQFAPVAPATKAA